MNLDAMRCQVDLYLRSRVCSFDRFGDRIDAMTASHVLDFEGKRVSPPSLLLARSVSTLKQWEGQAKSTQDSGGSFGSPRGHEEKPIATLVPFGGLLVSQAIQLMWH